MVHREQHTGIKAEKHRVIKWVQQQTKGERSPLLNVDRITPVGSDYMLIDTLGMCKCPRRISKFAGLTAVSVAKASGSGHACEIKPVNFEMRLSEISLPSV